LGTDNHSLRRPCLISRGRRQYQLHFQRQPRESFERVVNVRHAVAAASVEAAAGSCRSRRERRLERHPHVCRDRGARQQRKHSDRSGEKSIHVVPLCNIHNKRQIKVHSSTIRVLNALHAGRGGDPLANRIGRLAAGFAEIKLRRDAGCLSKDSTGGWMLCSRHPGQFPNAPLAKADCLLIREPYEPAAKAGSRCTIVMFQR
jgi:hypothetical protein